MQAELEAEMAPMMAKLKQMQEVVWTVDLYLGREETLHVLREGKPAPVDTPITVRQKVLVMAEESLVMMGRKVTGMDADDIPEFVNWLLESDENLDRILPEQRGVVVLIPTRVKSNSGNIWEDSAKDAANEESYWLLRNGERLHLLSVDPALRIRDRVLPLRDEFTSVFEQRLFGSGRRQGERLIPGSDEWLKLEKVADAKRRHYMRVIMVLQGIVDRTTVWAPLPPEGVNFLDVRSQDLGRVVLIQDGDTSIQLGDGHETFADYQKRLNGLLRPGLRIIGNWDNDEMHGERRDAEKYNGTWRVRPRHANLPQADVPHLIEAREDRYLIIRYPRTGVIYSGYDITEPKNRASCQVDAQADKWVLPFDLTEVKDLEYFLNSREERGKHFLTMVPTVRAALAAKQDEAQTEAPFRVLLGQLLMNEGAEAEAVDALVEDLVHWWKIQRTWCKPLNGEPQHEAKAAREIVAEYRSRRAHEADDSAEAMVKTGRRVPGCIAVARNRQGQWFAYAPSEPAHDARVFLDITPIRKNATLGTTKTWQHVPARSASLLNVAWSTDAWGEQKFAANPRHYLTGPERATLIAEIHERSPEGLALCVTEYFDPREPTKRFMGSYTWTDGTPETSPVVASESPLNWREDRKVVTSHGYRIVKDQHGARIDRASDDLTWSPLAAAFDHYSSSRSSLLTKVDPADEPRWGNTPWWPDDAKQWAGEVRPRLSWADEDALDRLKGYVDRCAAAAKTERKTRDERNRVAYLYVEAIQSLIRAQVEAEVHEKFVADFGAEAEDLWPDHLAGLTFRSPIHDRDLWGLIAIPMKHGHSFVGQTLDALADYAVEKGMKAPGEWHPDPRVDTKTYGDLVVPEVSDPDAKPQAEIPFT